MKFESIVAGDCLIYRKPIAVEASRTLAVAEERR
jgi:hypothetical protein